MRIHLLMDVYLSADAMQVASSALGVTAHNIANMNTDGFRASSVRYETGPDGSGVRLGEIREDAPPGLIGVGRIFDRYDGSEFVEASTTDVAREMVNLISEQRMFEANAVPMQVYDEMLGALVDRRV